MLKLSQLPQHQHQHHAFCRSNIGDSAQKTITIYPLCRPPKNSWLPGTDRPTDIHTHTHIHTHKRTHTRATRRSPTNFRDSIERRISYMRDVHIHMCVCVCVGTARGIYSVFRWSTIWSSPKAFSILAPASQPLLTIPIPNRRLIPTNDDDQTTKNRRQRSHQAY